MKHTDSIHALKQILLNYNKSDVIYLSKLKAELIKQFQIEISIKEIENYLYENGYTNIRLIEKKKSYCSNSNIHIQNNNIHSLLLNEDEDDDYEDDEDEDEDDDFDPNDFLGQNEEKIQQLMIGTSTYRDNTWMINNYQKNRNVGIFNEIIQKNMRLVAKVASHYSSKIGNKLDYDELVQEGILGLMKAIEKFDPAKGYQFSTYATWWIRQAITRAIIDKGFLIRIPVHMFEMVNKVLSSERESIINFNRINPEWVIDQLSISMEKYKEIKKIDHCFLHLASLDIVISQEDEDTTLIDLIETKSYLEIYDESEHLCEPEEIVLKKDRKQILINVMDSLKEKEREILLYRFGFKDGEQKTLEEIGKIYNVSRERIRQIEAKALVKLRKVMKNKRLEYELFTLE